MKTKFWFIALIIFAGSSIQAQEVNKTMFDEDKDKEILRGGCTRAGLTDAKFGDFSGEYEDYAVDPELISELKATGLNYSILVVLGSWCQDSREQVPRFFRILDAIGYDDGEISMIAVDGNKKCTEFDISEFDIEFVPTFIFYRQGEEIGRIVETPEVSLEADWLGIVQ